MRVRCRRRNPPLSCSLAFSGAIAGERRGSPSSDAEPHAAQPRRPCGARSTWPLRGLPGRVAPASMRISSYRRGHAAKRARQAWDAPRGIAGEPGVCDGSRRPRLRIGRAALTTTPGSRVIRVCPDSRSSNCGTLGCRPASSSTSRCTHLGWAKTLRAATRSLTVWRDAVGSRRSAGTPLLGLGHRAAVICAADPVDHLRQTSSELASGRGAQWRAFLSSAPRAKP